MATSETEARKFAKPSISHLDKAAFLVGTPIAHSSSPALHHSIYSSPSIAKNYAQVLCETQDLGGFVEYIRHEPQCMGSGVTMPFKVTVIPYLDALTPEGEAIGAVNTIFFEADNTKPLGRKFIGTNTDCIGIRDAFLNNVTHRDYRGKPGLVVGGGGTCRAAIYSLQKFLGCSPIYVINRDKDEVDAVMLECFQRGMFEKDLIHVQTLDQAKTLVSPGAIVSAIPDFTPATENEKMVRAILNHFLGGRDTNANSSSNEYKGALLEMCYHPSPDTQIAQVTAKNGWQVIGGIEAMIGQGLAQASLWTGINLDETVRNTARDAVRVRMAQQMQKQT